MCTWLHWLNKFSTSNIIIKKSYLIRARVRITDFMHTAHKVIFHTRGHFHHSSRITPTHVRIICFTSTVVVILIYLPNNNLLCVSGRMENELPIQNILNLLLTLHCLLPIIIIRQTCFDADLAWIFSSGSCSVKWNDNKQSFVHLLIVS